MNGFRKNKGIVLELTSLLDVIMIMLFWVMTDVSASADSQKEDAKAQVQAVTQQLEEQKQKSADELEKLREGEQSDDDADSNSSVTDDEEKITALKEICERFTPSNMPDFSNAIKMSLPRTAVWRIDIENATGKQKKKV